MYGKNKYKYEVEFYESPTGNNPVGDSLNQLAQKKEARVLLNAIYRSIDLLRQAGTFLGEPKVKAVNDNLWELRVQKIRILFFQFGSKFILLHYIVKKAQRLSRKDIRTAERRMKEWLERFGGGDSS